MATRWDNLYKGIINSASVSKIPVIGFFELTPRCNFHCRMCYICSQPDDKTIRKRELTAEQWISLGREARDSGLLFLTLTGGEIFLRNDFWNIYDAYSEMGFNLCLFTNASLITKEKAKRLGRNQPCKVSITIYGASPETYGKVTGHPEGYERTIKAIKMLLSEGIKVDIKTTVTKDNSSEFETLAELTESMGITIGVVNYISPRREGNCTIPEEARLSVEELVAYEKRIIDYNTVVTKNKKTSDIARIDYEEDVMMDVKLDKKELENIKSSPAFRCTAGSCAFWLSWDGKLSTCGLMSDPYSEPLKYGFMNSWTKLRKLCDEIPVCEECINCSFRAVCMTCPARLKAETGSYNKPAPYLCGMAKGRKSIGMGN